MLYEIYLYPDPTGIGGCTHIRTPSEEVARMIVAAARERGWMVNAYAVIEQASPWMREPEVALA